MTTDHLPTLGIELELLQCPRCGAPLGKPRHDGIACTSFACRARYPIAGGRPVLIDEDASIFSHAAYTDAATRPTPGLRDRAARYAPPPLNLSAVRSFRHMRDRLLAQRARPIVLAIGGSTDDPGIHVLMSMPQIRVITVDASPSSSATVFADAHALPFRDGSVHAVVVQAVLEHVPDPARCVDEIHRVLAPRGLVYAETPFMQQVHLPGLDFTRFSPVGHRRLFRHFSELDLGVVAGPATALAWAWRYFLAALAPRSLAGPVRSLARLSTLPLEQVDRLIAHRPEALDGASCTYFLGERSDDAVDDRTVLAGYRGALAGPRAVT